MSYHPQPHPYQRWIGAVVLPPRPPPAIIYYGLTPAGEAAVRYAISLLYNTLPDTYVHLFREIRYITVSPICGTGTLGCTNVRGAERTIFLSYVPEWMTPVNLAILIGHEGHHHFTINGQDYVQPHTCTDCSDPFQRATDWLYVWEDAVRPHLEETHRLVSYLDTVR